MKEILKLGEICQRRNNCCKFGSGGLAGDDLKSIGEFLGITEKELKTNYLEDIEKFNTKLLRPKLLRKNKKKLKKENT